MWQYRCYDMSERWYTIVYKNTVYKLKAMSHDDAMTRAKKCHAANMTHLKKCHGQKW